MQRTAANELLLLAVVNTSILVLFVFSFTKVRGRDWRSLSALPAFLVALFAEMYGFPLTIYVLSGWLADRFPHVSPFAYSAGQFWQTLLGLNYPALRYSIYLASYILIAGMRHRRAPPSAEAMVLVGFGGSRESDQPPPPMQAALWPTRSSTS